jgi:hypothetical protein
MREAMPLVAEWVDSLRDAFGADTINPMLKRIHAKENGHTLGKPAQHNVVGQPIGHAVAVSDMPDIVALMERNNMELKQKSTGAVKAVGNKRHKR